MLLQNQLFLPSTFSECAAGAQPHTWTSSTGTQHRIDYVALPKSWATKRPKMLAPELLDLTTTRADHNPVIVAVDLSGTFGQ
eukprot:5977656-Alexandrium_andersonii.AAC.1